MRQTKLTDALLSTKMEIEDHLMEACKHFRDVRKRAKN